MSMSDELQLPDRLRASEFFDSDHPAVVEFARSAAAGATPLREQAVRLYYAVRDQIKYNVYGNRLERPAMRASAVLAKRSGFCIHKSILMVAACRARGIPSRMALADVRNHIGSKRLLDLLGGDLFRFHAYAEIELDGRWIQATPVFNRSLCATFGVEPLEFDGVHDAVLQQYQADGSRSRLAFVHDHGRFDEFPYDLVVPGLVAHYPRLFGSGPQAPAGDLATEIAGERAHRAVAP